MCASSRPLNGADSDEYVLRPYRVLVREQDCPAYWIPVPAALGPRDAEGQARYRAKEYGIAFDVVRVELVP